MKKRKMMLLISLLVIGFAAVSTTLVLNGTFGFAFNTFDFDVYYSNVLVNGVSNKKVIKDHTKIEFDVDLSLINESYELDYFITNGSRNYDAELTMNCTESNEYLTIENDFVNGTILNATETTDGNKLKIVVSKVYAGDGEEEIKEFKIACNIVSTPVERVNLATGEPAAKVNLSNWEIFNDVDGDGISVGDLITIETESFYVYEIVGDTVKAISQYNLYVGNIVDSKWNVTPLENPTGLQSPLAKGWDVSPPRIATVAFDSINRSSVYENSEIKGYVDDYSNVLANMNANVDSVRLITKEELVSLGCDEDNYSCESAPDYIYSTSYWVTTFDDDGRNSAWLVESDGLFDFCNVDDNSTYGVRPIIELSKSLLG